MISTIAALLLSASSAAAVAVPDPGLPQLFVAACLDGNAAISADEAHKIPFDALPAELRARLDKPLSATAWQLQPQERAYLYVLEYLPGTSHDTKVCGLASDQMLLSSAVSAVDERITGASGFESAIGTQWLMPKAGYAVTAAKVDAFTVLQINWLSDSRRAALSKQVRQVSP